MASVEKVQPPVPPPPEYIIRLSQYEAEQLTAILNWHEDEAGVHGGTLWDQLCDVGVQGSGKRDSRAVGSRHERRVWKVVEK